MTQFSRPEFDRLGYTRVAIGNQMVGGRGVGMWSCSILAGNLQAALADADLLVGLARDVKAGDRVFLSSYLSERAYSDEVRDGVAQLLVTDVKRPDKNEPKRLPGSVSFRTLDMFQLGDKPKKVVEDRGEIETPTKQRRAS